MTLLFGDEIVKTGVPVPALQTATLVDKGKQGPVIRRKRNLLLGVVDCCGSTAVLPANLKASAAASFLSSMAVEPAWFCSPVNWNLAKEKCQDWGCTFEMIKFSQETIPVLSLPNYTCDHPYTLLCSLKLSTLLDVRLKESHIALSTRCVVVDVVQMKKRQVGQATSMYRLRQRNLWS
jgi:hypothetical protein